MSLLLVAVLELQSHGIAAYLPVSKVFIEIKSFRFHHSSIISILEGNVSLLYFHVEEL